MRGHRRKRILLRAATLAFFALVAALIAYQASAVDWPAVGTAIGEYRPQRLAAAAMLAAASYLLYCGYEIAARAYAGHRLPLRLVVPTAFVSYAFNLSLGALIGGGGMRYRLYSRAGMRLETVLRIAVFTVATNWLGYLILAGGMLLLAPVAIPGVARSESMQQVAAAAMLCVAAAYLLACARWHGKAWTLRGRRLKLPTLPLAAAQLLLSVANWLVLAGLICVLAYPRVDYPTMLTIVLIAAVAAAVMHIPAGLGVLEAVFIALLGARVPPAELLAVLAVHRAIYYLVPLLLAMILYLPLENRLRKHRHAMHELAHERIGDAQAEFPPDRP